MNTKKIILDTNVLMSIAEFRLDIFSEIVRISDFPYEICILEETLKELEKIIEEQKNKFKRAAKLALALIKTKDVKILNSDEVYQKADDILAERSRKGDLILTQDIGLKKRLSKPYLTIRQKKTIIFVK